MGREVSRRVSRDVTQRPGRQRESRRNSATHATRGFRSCGWSSCPESLRTTIRGSSRARRTAILTAITRRAMSLVFNRRTFLSVSGRAALGSPRCRTLAARVATPPRPMTRQPVAIPERLDPKPADGFRLSAASRAEFRPRSSPGSCRTRMGNRAPSDVTFTH